MARKSTASSNQKKLNASRPRQRAASPAEKSARKAGAKAAPAVDSADHLFDERTRRDITGVVFAILAVVLMVAAILPSDAVVTSFVSQALHLTFGLGAYLLPLFLLACGISFLVRFDRERVPTRIAVGLGLVFVALLTLLALTMPVGPEGGAPEQIFDPDQLTLRGGYIGAGIAWAGYTLFGQVVSVIIMVGVIVIGLVIIGLSFSGIIEKVRERRLAKEAEEREMENVMPAPPYADAAAGFVPVNPVGGDPARARAASKRDRRHVEGAAATQVLDPGKTERARSKHAAAETVAFDEAEPQTLTRKLGRKHASEDEPARVAVSPAEKKASRATKAPKRAPEPAPDGFMLPSMDLLCSTDPAERAQENEEELRETASCLQETLEDFKIMAQVVGWVAGPTVTLFKVDLPAGVRVSRVTALEADIALALAAPGVRIFAPIPGTNYVGIEVPNRSRRTVFLGDVLSDAPDGPLQIAIGEDVEGHHIVTDLAKMPHLLIGGTTGSGKSVSINAMIMSILMRATPSEVRFIMVDPKRVEFTPYNGIPHLYVPVVTEAKEAASALAWGVAEMERRLKVFSKAGARNIGQFNEMCEKEAVAIAAAEAKGEEPPEAVHGDKLPYIVIIIDELADLMMNVGKEVEFSISRIAQLACGRLLARLLGGANGLLLGLHLGVVLPDVARAHLREHLQAPFHLGHAPRKGARGLLGLGDHGHVQMRDAVVRRELHALRVDHDEAHLGGSGAHEDGHDHGVDGDRLARAGGAADEQVRHLGEVGDDGVALDVFPDGDHERAALGVFEHVAEKHGLARLVRHLDAHVVRPGDGREDAHARCRESKRDVVGERRHAAHAHAGGQVHLEERDGGAGHPAHHLGHDAEIFERLLQMRRRLRELLFGNAARRAVGVREEIERGQREALLRMRRGKRGGRLLLRFQHAGGRRFGGNLGSGRCRRSRRLRR